MGDTEDITSSTWGLPTTDTTRSNLTRSPPTRLSPTTRSLPPTTSLRLSITSPTSSPTRFTTPQFTTHTTDTTSLPTTDTTRFSITDTTSPPTTDTTPGEQQMFKSPSDFL